ncbi:hypothetical protein CIB48_g4511 [Xylaria polymorpha]|nr:hypothetical protein CIB48_g4511 [Xylaria polymorpha]
MVTIRTTALAVLPLLGSALGYANPKTCTGTCTNSHDPAIIRRSDGTYFRFSTNGKIAVHTAPAITGPWTYKGAAISSGSSIDLPGNQDLWAPDVSLVGNTYYLYYAVSQFGSQNSAIGVATSTTLDVGSWTDHGATGVKSSSDKPYNAIDANLISADGKYYLTWGSFWKDIYQAEMKASSPLTLASGVSSYQLAYDPATTAVEGAFVFKYGSYYYLFYSKGQCCGYDTSMPAAGGEYKILVCRSSTVTGGGVYQDPTYGPILYYHYVDKTIGYADGDKRFGWNTIDFSSGWPVV